MENLKISEKYKNILNNFSKNMQDVYHDELASLILYGSAASGEFVDKYSNLNVIAVLKNTDLEILEKSSKLICKYKMINVLFLTKDYIASSTDVFPIEFLDMQDNYIVIYGEDILKDIRIDIRNLRFQCEQELKGKLLKLKQMYLASCGSEGALRRLLFLSFASILHILRNVLRLKGKKPPYLKQDVIKEISSEFQVDNEIWQKILVAKNKQVKLSKQEVMRLFVNFTRDLEKIINMTDKL
jgi:predicted nucleotidyltransferase